MTVDYSRDTFRPALQYSAVRLQQGRVAVDADWNEAVDIAQGATRTTNADVIGPTGMPAAAPGFEIMPVADAGRFDLLVGEGRAYVGGILVEHDAAPTTLTRVSGAGANTVWSVDLGARLAVGQWLGPADDPKSNLLAVASIEAAQAGDEGRQRIKLHKAFGAGTQSVRAFASLRVQPQLPQAAAPETAGPYLAYLDVWERAITALEDPLIAEVALGGVDTAVRTQVVWQVKLLALQPLIDAGRLTAPPMCKSFPAGWSPDDASDRVQLKARARAEAATTNPCELPARGGYRSLENQLYRVEVHSGGVVGTDKVRIKWSRDNGVHRSRLLDVVEGSFLVEEIGKDDATAFGTDDWLEVLDEGRILRGEPGFFVEIGEVVGTRLGIRQILDPVTLAPLVQNDAPNADALPKRGLVRRWEGGTPVEVTPAQPMALERGIEIEIPSGRAHVGDYWLIPARGLTAGIEWPADAASGGPASLPPRGVVHAYCPLALLTKADPGGWTLVDDCRPIFSPLTRLDSFFYLGGDGQETRPDLTAQGGAAFTALEQPLRVGVARGRAPIKGRPVRFSVVDQSNPGRLTPAAGTNAGDVIASTPQRLILRTNAEGVAAAAFTMPNSRHANHVTAELLDASDPPQASRVHLPITFTATTSIAGEVAYDPAACAFQNTAAVAPGVAKTVQAAIDKLCPRIDFVPLGGGGQSLCANLPAPAPLKVGLFWGKQPLKGAKVAFKVESGDAKVNPDSATTDDNGIATTQIVAGRDPFLNGGVVRVTASAQGLAIPATPVGLEFFARFIDAACVFAGPEVCKDLRDQAQTNTVAGLLDFLCKRAGQKRDLPFIKGIEWRHDDVLPIARFRGNGIAVSCSETMIAEVVSNDVFIVTWEVPFGFLIGQADATLPDFFTPQVMTGQVTLDGESRIVFKPSIQMNDAAVKRIADIVRRVFDLPGIRCRVRLIGRAILAKRDNRPLDGFVPMVPRGRQLDLDFRNPGSGEPSDFESWFYLVDG